MYRCSRLTHILPKRRKGNYGCRVFIAHIVSVCVYSIDPVLCFLQLYPFHDRVNDNLRDCHNRLTR